MGKMTMTTILIAEDEAIVAADLANKLKNLNYEVVGIATNGHEAVEMALKLHPSIVLMDIQLDDSIDGIQAAEAINRNSDIPVLYLTAQSDGATLERAKLTGPFGYVLKPFDERDIVAQIELALHKHQVERRLRDQREWLRVTLTSIGDAVIATDAEGRVSFINPVAESLTGWKAEAAIDRPIAEVFRIVNEQTGQAMKEPVARVLRDGRKVELANHTALVTKKGHLVPVEDSAAPILDAAGQVIGAVLVFYDVTAKRRSEQKLKASEAKLRSIFQASPVGIGVVSDRMFQDVNERFCELTGYSREELTGKSARIVYASDEDFEYVGSEKYRQIKEGGTGTVETRMQRKDGRIINIILGSTPLDENDLAAGVTFTALDITERKKAEENLCQRTAVLEGINRIFQKALTCRTEEELGRMCLEVAEEVTSSRFSVIGELDSEGRFYDIAISNPGTDACRMIDPLKHAASDEGMNIPGLYGTILRAGKGFYTNHPSLHPDSTGIPEGHIPLQSFLGVPLIHDGKIIGIIGVANRKGGYRGDDLSALEMLAPSVVQALFYKRANRALSESEEDLKRGQAVSQTGTWRLDIRRNKLHWSEEVYRIFGVPIGTSLTYETFLSNVHPDDRQFVDQQWMSALKGHPYDVEHRIVVGGQIKWVREKAELEFDDRGAFKGGFGTSQDITERKHDQMALSESNQELNEYAYALTHNLKAPFRAVQNYAGFLTEDLADRLEDEPKQYLEGIKKAIIQAADQFADLESLYRVRNYPVDSEAFELAELLHEMQAIFQNDSGREIVIAPKLLILNCCKFLLRQTLLNLIENGFKYNRSDIKKVEVGWQPGAGTRFEIFVRDNGIGIEPKYNDHIFGIFKRLHTNREYEGSGIGLAIVKRAVQNIDGEIRVESAVGKGSTFYVNLPGSIMENTDYQFQDR